MFRQAATSNEAATAINSHVRLRILGAGLLSLRRAGRGRDSAVSVNAASKKQN
jgi:hypothetical protein